MSRVSVILLAAGYGTRLYPLTIDQPKALLPLGQGVLLDAVIKKVRALSSVREVVLVSNHRFAGEFEAWRHRTGARIMLVDDGTTTPVQRLGAIRDLQLAWQQVPTDDVLVIGTDNLFSWSLAPFVRRAQRDQSAARVATWHVPRLQDARLYGVVQANRRGQIVRFEEKPAHPASRAIALCVYYFPAPIRKRVAQFVRQRRGQGDAPGRFVAWLAEQEPVYAAPSRGQWFDIGSQESYREVLAWTARGSARLPRKRASRRSAC